MIKPQVLYRLFDEHDTLLYIGVTTNFKTRLSSHRRKPWGKTITRWEVDECLDGPPALLQEMELLPRLRPLHNVFVGIRQRIPGSVQGNFILDPDNWQRLRIEAARTGRTQSEIVNDLIARALPS